jgi:hypothetical protein
MSSLWVPRKTGSQIDGVSQNCPMSAAIPTDLKHRPAIHQLCYGVFLQGPIRISGMISVFPLKALGFDVQADYARGYASSIVGEDAPDEIFKAAKQQCAKALPCISIVQKLPKNMPAEQMEQAAAPIFSHARAVVGWATGEIPYPFALISAAEVGGGIRLIPPQSTMRQRLGLGNIGEDFEKQLAAIMRCAENDPHFAFALSLFRESLREEDPEFRVARHFACLEALAYKLKKKKVGSRDAVRELLGLRIGAYTHFKSGEKEGRYDRIEVGGKIRDKLFHGAKFEAKNLTREAQDSYRYLSTQADELRNLLLVDCEMQLSRWAHGVSNGQTIKSPAL